ncbi:Protein NUCLEAR FUSION DEFECTIVE 6 chloroplastic/mitochondrial [Bienertia sinuspersici]
MAVASIGGRSTLIRNLCIRTHSISTASQRFIISPSSTTTSPFFLRQTRFSPSSFRLPRELSSLLPAHNATASACLVSRLPDRPSTSAECCSDLGFAAEDRRCDIVK